MRVSRLRGSKQCNYVPAMRDHGVGTPHIIARRAISAHVIYKYSKKWLVFSFRGIHSGLF
jgi:hypothetical protein